MLFPPKTRECAHSGGAMGSAEVANGRGVIAFGEAFAVRADQEWVVGVGWFGVAEQGLQQALDVGGGFEVDAAGDEGDALQRVVVGDAKMVAGGRVLAGEDDVPDVFGVAGEAAFAEFVEAERPGFGDGAGAIEAQRVGCAGGDPGGAFRGGEAAANAGVEGGAVGAVRGVGGVGGFSGDVGAGAEAGVEQAARGEVVEGGAVVGQMVRLDADFAVPFEAEPGEVVGDGGGVVGAAAAGVDILKTQQETAPASAGGAPGEQGGISVAEMQIAGRARGKARGRDHLSGIAWRR